MFCDSGADADPSVVSWQMVFALRDQGFLGCGRDAGEPCPIDTTSCWSAEATLIEDCADRPLDGIVVDVPQRPLILGVDFPGWTDPTADLRRGHLADPLSWLIQ